MKKGGNCGLLGEKLGHSRSPEIHRLFGDYGYRLFEKTPAEVREFLLHGDYDAINVTIPYKKTAFELCDRVSPVAAKLGNVNVVVRRDGGLFGDNTDAFGFKALLDSTGIDVAGEKCTVLGSGGAAATVCAVLAEAGAAETVVVSRRGENNYSNLERHADTSLLVNTTPVGMYPDVGSSPVSLDVFPRLRAVIDLIYNPSPTKLLFEAEQRGIPAAGGLLMLVAQAWKASEYFGRRGCGNIYLYGPPGCGKSTLGRALARALDMSFTDLDAEICDAEAMTVPEIFAARGEAEFRRMEKSHLKRISNRSGFVVALGGGALLDPESRAIAESTGGVLPIECTFEALVARTVRSGGRPLLDGDVETRLRKLMEERSGHYRSFLRCAR